MVDALERRERKKVGMNDKGEERGEGRALLGPPILMYDKSEGKATSSLLFFFDHGLAGDYILSTAYDTLNLVEF